MAPHSSTLAWKIPWTEEPGKLQSMGLLRVGHERLHFHFSLSCIGGGNGNPLQCSCLENPRNGGAWWAAICGVAQSRTWLKWLSSSSTLWNHQMLLAYLIFLAPDLEIVTPPRSPGSFCWRMVLEINIWDIPGGLVVETLSFLCRGHRFDHWLRN